MFKLQPDPTFDTDVRVTRPGGEQTTLRVSFRYLDEDQYAEHTEKNRAEPIDVFMAPLVAGWEVEDCPKGSYEGLPMEFSTQALAELRTKQPRVLQAMLATWLHEVKGLPLKN